MSYNTEFKPANDWKVVGTTVSDLSTSHFLIFDGDGTPIGAGDLKKNDKLNPITAWGDTCLYVTTDLVTLTYGIPGYKVKRYTTISPKKIYCFPPGWPIPNDPPEEPLLPGSGAIWVAEEGPPQHFRHRPLQPKKS